MVVHFSEDPTTFRRLTESYLLRAEGENNLMVGLVKQIEDGAFENFWLASIEGEPGQVVGCAIQTPPHWVLLTRTPASGISALVSELVGRAANVSGVLGPLSACDAFAEAWCRETNATSSVHMTQGIYQLEKVKPPSRPAPGLLRAIGLEDVDQVAAWHDAFVQDTGIPDVRDGREVALQHVERQSLFVWEDDGVSVSMAGFSGPTPNGIRVNHVYTPPECRGRGYASTCVATVSQLLLDRGRRFCFLYTDMDNPTSNAIYQKIGYRKVSDSVVLEFDYGID